jgi:hypothetical protein
MKKLFAVLVMMCFVLTVSVLSFAQVPSTTALEKAIENSTGKGGDTKPTDKPNADKMKAKEEKAVKGRGVQDTVSTEKAAAETAAEEKAKAALPKM